MYFPIKKNIPFVLFFTVFLVYLTTVCPSVYVGDSGELSAAAFSLGIPHPSGYPLYALTGKLFCLIPLGSIAFRMNLMSVVFSVAAILVIYSIIYRFTLSIFSSIFGTLILAFSQIFWLQTVSAEVYPLHSFFVALIIRMLIYWDDHKGISSLSLFVFIIGLSFLNHLQTVMLAPAVMFFLVYSDRKGVLNIKSLSVISLFFIFALTAYIYLPIRTQAGAAIHWGDPDTFINFWSVVSGSTHRSLYIFNQSILDFVLRGKDAFIMVIKQFGILIIAAILGFLKVISFRWKVFFALLIIFDFFYTVFLNTVSIEITAFNLPTLIVISILSGIGVNGIIKRCKGLVSSYGGLISRIINVFCFVVPAVFLVSNYYVCDQSRNYNGYEYSLNALRTVNREGILFVDGDNNIFPVAYARFAERMREEVAIYDRKNIFLRLPFPERSIEETKYGENWGEKLSSLQREFIIKNIEKGVFFFVFDPYSISLSENYRLIPYGTILQVINGDVFINEKMQISIWKYYATESLEDTFYLDYMNRQIASFYHYVKGRHLVILGGIELGLQRLKIASEIGYNDEIIHTELAVFYTDYGLYDKAREELQKAFKYNNDYALVYNNWGYYYSKTGEIDKAIDSIRKAVELNPGNTIYYNNLGNMLLKAGNKDEAFDIFRESLSLKGNQKEIKKILQGHDSETIIAK